jgi:hypothetical protein
MGHTACTEPHCLYKGALYLLPYLFTRHVMVSTPYFGGRFVSASDSESYANSSIVIGTASVAGQVKGHILDNRRYAACTEAVRWQRQH